MPISTSSRSLNMSAGIRDFARSTPEAVAVVDGTRTFTFAAVESRARRLANVLLQAGFEPGDRIAVLLGNRAEYVEIPAALGRIGLIMVPLNPRLSVTEVGYILTHSKSNALIVDTAYVPLVKSSLTQTSLRLVLTMPDPQHPTPSDERHASMLRMSDYETALSTAADTDSAREVSELDPFTIVYTSGTTGRPKGVVISHRSRVLTGLATGLDWGLGPGHTTIAVAPMYHGAGFILAYASPMLGGTLWMLRSFDAEALLAMVDQSRSKSIFMVPTHAQMLRSLGPEALARYDCSCLADIYFNAAPLPFPLKEWVMQTFPSAGVHEMYGSTEASIVTNLRPAQALTRPGSVGTAWFQTEIRLIDEEGHEVGAGGTGELFSRSPYLMNGYLDDDAATTACITPDGFLTSGDVARMDADGYLYIVDRKKDLIISGGLNIYPREIEDVLLSHPEVRDAGVVGVPSEQWGESLMAFVVLASDATVGPSGLEQLCRDMLASYKVPRQWRVVDGLPRNAAGKILKTQLRVWATE